MESQKVLIESDQQYIMQTYARSELVLTAGRSAVAYGADMMQYIDFTSGIGVNSLGFCDKEWCTEVCKQVMTLQHASNLYHTAPDHIAAKLLCEKTGYARVFFSNSGAEANEGAIKLARLYSEKKYGAGRYKIVTLTNSFHGRTITTLSATGQEVFHQKFQPLTEGFVYVRANDAADLREKLDDTVCAIMLEFVQGEGGVLPLKQEFVDAAAELCKERDILLIADEVQTGVGRTGTFLASEQFGVKPDITTLAKGLGGGLPIGAVLTAEKCDVFCKGDHGSTFGGNPVCCTGARVVLTRMTDELLQDVREKGKKIRETLSELDEVEEITGLGMMVGIRLRTKKAAEVRETCMQQGLLILTAKDRLRLLPPLTISQDELRRGLRILKQVLESGTEERKSI